MGEIYPTEAWPSDAAVSQLDGQTDAETGLPYIAKGTGPTSDPPLEIQYNRQQHRLKRIVAPWNQGRVVDEGAGTIGVYPIRYWMDGIMQVFEGASGVAVPADATRMVYIDQNGLLQLAADWPGAAVSYLPLAVVTCSQGAIAISDARAYAAFRLGRDAALWPLGVQLQVQVSPPSGNSIDVTIQALDPAGQALPGLFEVHAWLADTPAGGTTATAPDGGATATTGVVLATESPLKRWQLVTREDGQIVLRITHSGTRSWYLLTQTGGRIVGSSEIAFQ